MDDFPEPLEEPGLEGLPGLMPLTGPWPLFSIPRLEDKPQNPIISALDSKPSLKPASAPISYHQEGTETRRGAEWMGHKGVPEDIWLAVKGLGYGHEGHLVSWDTLRRAYCTPKLASPFVSEQTPDVLVASRDSSTIGTSGRRITTAELHDALASTLVGCASVLSVWDPVEQRFVKERSTDDKPPVTIDGMDKVTSQSYVSKFVEFGTLFRRIDMLIGELRKNTREDRSAVFAFAHSLSSVLLWTRHEIGYVLSGLDTTLCDIWVSLQDVQSVLVALGSLCSRDIRLNPGLYQPLPQSPQHLLSHIYDFLTFQVEGQSSRLVRAVLSYVLTVTSRPYFSGLARSIGLVDLEDMLIDARRKAAKIHGDTILDEQEENMEELDSELELENNATEAFPSFVSEEVKDAVVRARRSIRILSSPEFEGSQKVDLPRFRKLEWIWIDEEVSRRVQESDEEVSGLERSQSYVPALQQPSMTSTHKYKPELAGLAAYDLEPGSLSRELDAGIAKFIISYPTYPPALAPTLPLLSELVLSPILAQANALGRAALQHFLTPGTSLHLRAHLVLLRAYVLLAAPSFKARLSAALFSDADEDDGEDEGASENPMGVTIRTRARNANRREVQRKRDGSAISRERRERRKKPWPVGLAFGLTKQAEWPPGGSDLSFYLRRVIMDSLEHVRESENMYNDPLHKDELGDDEFWDEAESRLGFAIRDLPVGTGNEKWLDPTRKLQGVLSGIALATNSSLIEALDFLYMQYRPPDPLRCLITEEILSKYQRIFAFLLRLLRVEAAMRTVFRLTRPCAVERIFPDYPDVQGLVLHFRFSAQTLVSALSAFVADTAIRGNIDSFIARVRYAEIVATSHSDEHIGPFPDVYALMQRHSRVLDAILAACLLRGAQRAVGDILRALLEVILEFAVLVGNVYRAAGRDTRVWNFDEEGAAQRVQGLYAKFCKTRYGLIKALRKIAERGSKPFAKETGRSGERLPPASGGMEALVDLLLRIGDTRDVQK